MMKRVNISSIIFISVVGTDNAEFGIRLTGGDSVTEGLVEVKVKGTWGTVSGQYWNDDGARVCFV